MALISHASLAHYLPDGTEVVYEHDTLKRIGFGTVVRERSFRNGKMSVDSLSIRVASVTDAGVSNWVSLDSISILKINPTPQQKMLYMLKGAK